MSDAEIVDRFHLLWYEKRQRRTWRDTSWLGVPAQQCPCDMWVYQEIVTKTRPDTVIELGVKNGGTTLYFANLLDLLYGMDDPRGRVIGVDIELKAHPEVRKHPRITLIQGDSSNADTFNRVRRAAGSRTLVLLDSDHSEAHVRAELDLYSRLVPAEGYLIVNDTNINGHPALPWKGPGPYEAVESFLREREDFVVDEDCEKHMLTQSPRGFLRRVALEAPKRS